MKSRVAFERLDDGKGWIASLKADPRIKAEGKTKAEAIGRMYILHADILCFFIVKPLEDHEP